MKTLITTSICCLIATIFLASCKKHKDPSVSDMLVGRWKPSYQGAGSGQIDYIQINDGGTGVDTRVITGSNTYVIGFSWTLDNSNNITAVTTSGPSGHYSYLDGTNHIESIDGSTLVIRDIVNTTFADTLLKQ